MAGLSKCHGCRGSRCMTSTPAQNSVSIARVAMLTVLCGAAGLVAGSQVSWSTGQVATPAGPPSLQHQRALLSPEAVGLLAMRDSGQSAALLLIVSARALRGGDEDLGRQYRDLMRRAPPGTSVMAVTTVEDSAMVHGFLQRERLHGVRLGLLARAAVLTPGSPELGLPSVIWQSRPGDSAVVLTPLRNSTGVRAYSYADALGFLVPPLGDGSLSP